MLELPPDLYDRVMSESKRLRIDPPVLIEALLKMLGNETDASNETNVTYITVDEATEILRMSRSSIGRMRKRGEIPTVEIGSRVLLPLDAVKKTAAAHAKLLNNSSYIEDLEECITSTQAARYLKVHSDTLHKWIREGKIPAHHIGRRFYLIKKEDLETFLKERTIKPIA